MTRAWDPAPASRERLPTHPEPSSLVDILERVLDKGIVVAGDIRVDLLDIELLTIRLRLLIASVDRAKEMGIDWWEHDPTLSSGARDLAAENRQLRERIGALESGRTAGSGSRARRAESAVTPPTRSRKSSQ
jgi:Gas vesicle protein